VYSVLVVEKEVRIHNIDCYGSELPINLI